MKVIKRNGKEVNFDRDKIVSALMKANASVAETDRLSKDKIREIADNVEASCGKLGREASVEEIQDLVESQLMKAGSFHLAKHYITYRYTRSLARKSNTTDEKILSLIDCVNEEALGKTPTKILWLIPPSGIIWRERFQGI